MPVKTQPTKQSVAQFINAVEHEQRRKDAKELLKIFKEITGITPKLWSNTMIGYGKYHYKYKSGQEGDWFLTGFSPRKANMSLHVMMAQKDYADLLAKLGPHKTGVGCLYLKNLEDIHIPTLKKLIKKGFEDMKKTYP